MAPTLPDTKIPAANACWTGICRPSPVRFYEEGRWTSKRSTPQNLHFPRVLQWLLPTRARSRYSEHKFAEHKFAEPELPVPNVSEPIVCEVEVIRANIYFGLGTCVPQCCRQVLRRLTKRIAVGNRQWGLTAQCRRMHCPSQLSILATPFRSFVLLEGRFVLLGGTLNKSPEFPVFSENLFCWKEPWTNLDFGPRFPTNTNFLSPFS